MPRMGNGLVPTEPRIEPAVALSAWDPLDTAEQVGPALTLARRRPPLGRRAAVIAEWGAACRGALGNREPRSRQLRTPPGKVGRRQRVELYVSQGSKPLVQAPSTYGTPFSEQKI